MIRKEAFKCNFCREQGTIHFQVISMHDGRTSIEMIKDEIPHASSCPKRQKGAQPKHFKKKRWAKQEKKANDMVGSRPTRNSGAVFGDGDGRTANGFRLECKGTKEEKFRVSHGMWNKLREGALKIGEEPVLHIELGDGRIKTVLVLIRACLLTEPTMKIPYKTLHKGDLSSPPKSLLIGKDQVAIISEEKFKCLKTDLFPQ